MFDLVYKNATLPIKTKIGNVSFKESNLRANILSNFSLRVNFTATRNGKIDLKLYDINGNLVKSANFQTITGENHSHTFGKLQSGFYIAQVRNNGSIERAKVVIP